MFRLLLKIINFIETFYIDIKSIAKNDLKIVNRRLNKPLVNYCLNYLRSSSINTKRKAKLSYTAKTQENHSNAIN